MRGLKPLLPSSILNTLISLNGFLYRHPEIFGKPEQEPVQAAGVGGGECGFLRKCLLAVGTSVGLGAAPMRKRPLGLSLS